MPKAHRGEVWQIDPGITGKVRPAVVVSVEFYRGLTGYLTAIALGARVDARLNKENHGCHEARSIWRV